MNTDFNIIVNGRPVGAMADETLLTVLRRNGFRIPTLCHMASFSPTGACRLCVVEVEGLRDLVTSCAHPVEEGMQVHTNTPRVIRARKTLVELLLSNHPDECLYCQRNGNCELQWLAEEMNVKERKYFGPKRPGRPDHSAASVFRDPAKCVLCSRCVRVCEEVQLVAAIDFINRAGDTVVNSAFNKGLNVKECIDCGQCISVCPTAALLDMSHLEKVQAALDQPNQQTQFFISPSALVSLALSSGLKADSNLFPVLSEALKKCGARQVLHLGEACLENIRAEAKHLVESLANKENTPLFSSCCPAWVNYLEAFRPEWLPMLMPGKSPQQLAGAALKASFRGKGDEESYTVALMPCVAKKQEAGRETNIHQGVSEVDAVLSVRELLRMLRSHGIMLERPNGRGPDLEQTTPIPPMALKMGYSSGKAESVATECIRLMQPSMLKNFRFSAPRNPGGRNESRIQLGRQSLGFAWVSGIAAADAYIGGLMASENHGIHYVEVMACPGGCVGGGGHPLGPDANMPAGRKRVCQEMEKMGAEEPAS